MFKASGYEEVTFDDVADIYIINTCTVTHLADRKSRQMIRRANKTNPEAIIVVTGCYAQTASGEVLEIAGVDLVIGTRDRFRMLELIEEAKNARTPLNAVTDIMQATQFEEISGENFHPQRARAYLKVQEGCNQFCSYCIIPYARGPIRSRPVDNTVQAAEKLVNAGYKEIILTGIHTGAYGAEMPNDIDLAFLVSRLIEVPGLRRLRISSIDPNEINDRLLDIIKNSSILCRHLHIPLQSGDDAVLKRMNRVYSTSDYAKLSGVIRELMPEIAITTDVMVGFPGETEAEFANTLRFIEQMNFSDLHVFKYSPRKGTPAADFVDQIPPEIKEARSKELISLGRRLSAKYAEKFIGRKLQVLVEQTRHFNDQEYWEGHTDNYLTVAFPSELDLKGKLIDVRLDKYQDGIIIGTY